MSNLDEPAGASRFNPNVPVSDSLLRQVLDSIYDMQDAQDLFHWRLRTKLGLGISELSALQFIARRERTGTPPRPKDIVHQLGLTSGAGSFILNRLATRSFITKHPHPEDGRALVIRLTPETRERLEQTGGENGLGRFELNDDLSDRDAQQLIAAFRIVTSSLSNSARAIDESD